MAKGKPVHVTPRGDQWAVQREGNQRATRLLDTQREAIDVARPIARQDQTELIIHGTDGKIRSTDSHGHDPNPPRDTDR